MRGGPINYMPAERMRYMPQIELARPPTNGNNNPPGHSPFNLYIMIDGHLVNVFELLGSDSGVLEQEPLSIKETDEFTEAEKKKEIENKQTRDKMLTLRENMKEANSKKAQLKNKLTKPIYPKNTNQELNPRLKQELYNEKDDKNPIDTSLNKSSSKYSEKRKNEFEQFIFKRNIINPPDLQKQDSFIDFFTKPESNSLVFVQSNDTSYKPRNSQQAIRKSTDTIQSKKSSSQKLDKVASKVAAESQPLYSRLSKRNLQRYGQDKTEMIAVESTPIKLPSYHIPGHSRSSKTMNRAVSNQIATSIRSVLKVDSLKLDIDDSKTSIQAASGRAANLQLKRTDDYMVANQRNDKELITKSFDRGVNMPLGTKTNSGGELLPTKESKERNSGVKLPSIVSPNKCHVCSKKLGISNTHTCRCGHNFCIAHRLPEQHKCTYDYKNEGRKELAKKNPKVEKSKVKHI